MTSVRLIFTDLAANNNKFWHCEVIDNNVLLNWGRVGDSGQRKTIQCPTPTHAQKYLETHKNSKLRKGYTVQQTLGSQAPSVAYVAKVQIQHNNDKETIALIDFLIKRNIHKIEGATSIRLEAGKLTTPLGPVTVEGLDLAEDLISKMINFDDDFPSFVNQYLRIVPRNIGRRKVEPTTLFGSVAQLQAEQALVDSLRVVVKDAEQKAVQDAPPVFQTKLQILDASAADFNRLNKLFTTTLNNRHQSAHLKLKKVWEMSIEHAEKEFEAGLGNIKQLWHGTKDANLLSILKNGYVIPKRNGSIAITGRMYGDGIYFSDQSTKSLNYASGYWGGTSQRMFMLFNDVAMGKEYIPTRGFSGIPKGYDSTFAQAGRSGVMNNEMIVYRTSQVKPVFLCEFSG